MAAMNGTDDLRRRFLRRATRGLKRIIEHADEGA